ncbi:MAG: DUF58 domain-containing protein [Bacteroidales bacterium]|jgi:uncharacterized protein (DUF58 family)|nr:DUF58 domain-containing protein [Bacteroidales bacterium]
MKTLQDIENLQQFDNFEFIANQIVEGFITGLHRSPFHGFSVEFAEHRLYNQGESTKHIDWKLYAKTDKLFVKRFEEETNLRCHIVIDTSSSMLYPFQDKKLDSKLDFSLYSAAALIHLLKKQRDAAGLSFFDTELHLHTEAKLTQTHIQRLYAELNRCLHSQNEQSFEKETNIASVLHHIAELAHNRSLIIIFSDFFQNTPYEELYAAFQHLKYNKHEIIVFHTIEPQTEEFFEFSNKPLHITDMETGEKIKIHPNLVRDNYAKNVQTIIKNLSLKCAEYGIDYNEADINKGFHQVLLSFLIKRNKLF